MKAQELRIGNYIKFQVIDRERIIKVDARFFRSVAISRESNEIEDNDELSDYYQPIPLTPDILEKCGFEKFKGLWNYKLVPIGYELNLVKINGLNENEFENQIGESIKHLHHLQNLYYALTGEELNYKP